MMSASGADPACVPLDMPPPPSTGGGIGAQQQQPSAATTMGGLSDGGAAVPSHQQQRLQPLRAEDPRISLSMSTATADVAAGPTVSRPQEPASMPPMFLLQDIWGK